MIMLNRGGWIRACFAMAALTVVGGSLEAQEFKAEQFAIVVPVKSPDPIARIKVEVQLDVDNVSFTVRNPVGEAVTFSGLTPVTSGFATAPQTYPNTDRAWVVRPDGTLPVTDPARRRYQVFLDLRSDHAFFLNGDCTQALITQPEQWIIEADGQKIIEVVHTSFNYETTGGCVSPTNVVVSPLPTVEGAIYGCAEGGSGPRPPVHAVLVLDRSGSMNSSVTGAPTAEPKMAALRRAVSDFVEVWTAFRAAEAACGAVPNDQIGIATFGSSAQWWPALGTGLQPFSSGGPIILGNISGLMATGMTAMGSGLLLADGVLPPSGSRRVVLMMSNGKQNRSPYAGVSGSSVGTLSSSTFSALPNGGYPVFTVTVGTSVAVDPLINQNLATTSGGAYTNTEDNATLMRPFFLQVLENTISFATAQTVLLDSGTLPSGGPGYSRTVPFPASSRLVSVNLMWPQGVGTARLSVTTPNDVRFERTDTTTVRFNVPTGTRVQAGGDWRFEASFVSPFGNVTALPFELMVLSEDPAIRAQADIAPGDYAPGQPLLLRVRLSAFGLPLTGLGPGAVRVHRLAPGQAIGDVLARVDLPRTGVQEAGDSMSAAEAQLAALLQEHPDLLDRTSSTLILNDDGQNGDAVAGDGIYSVRFVPEEYGNYNFVFEVEGATPETGSFRRQQIRTVFVRPLPDPVQTEVQSSIQDGALALTLTPRTRTGSLLGPDWGPYFWFTSPGMAPRRPVYARAGSYVVRIPLGADGTPPPVSLHFIDAPLRLDEQTTPETLPVRLDTGTTLLGSVERGKQRGQPATIDPGPRPRGCGGIGLSGFGVGLLLGVTLLGGVVGRRRRKGAPS
jgi:hypothetical protein